MIEPNACRRKKPPRTTSRCGVQVLDELTRRGFEAKVPNSSAGCPRLIRDGVTLAQSMFLDCGATNRQAVSRSCLDRPRRNVQTLRSATEELTSSIFGRWPVQVGSVHRDRGPAPSTMTPVPATVTAARVARRRAERSATS